MSPKFTKYFLISAITILYVVTSLISTLHVIEFFELSNPHWLAVTLAIAFEIGAAATLAALTVLDQINKAMVWVLFIVLTVVQINGNLFYAYVHLHDYQSWIELFGLTDSDPIEQKRILSIISGAILPLVSLGFIKSLVDYMKPAKVNSTASIVTMPPVQIDKTELTPVELEPEVAERVLETTNTLPEDPDDKWVGQLQRMDDLSGVLDMPLSKEKVFAIPEEDWQEFDEADALAAIVDDERRKEQTSKENDEIVAESKRKDDAVRMEEILKGVLVPTADPADFIKPEDEPKEVKVNKVLDRVKVFKHDANSTNTQD